MPVNASPLGIAKFGPDTEGADFVVLIGKYAVVSFTEQNVGEVSHAKTLAGAINAGQSLLGRDCGVPLFRCLQAIIAIAAMFGLLPPGGLLVKVSQQSVAATACRFTQAQHGFELLVRDAFLYFAGAGVRGELPQGDDILKTVGHPGIGGFAIAAGAPGFLVIGLYAFR